MAPLWHSWITKIYSPSLLPQNQSEEGTLGVHFRSSYVAGILSFPSLKPASNSFTGMEILFVPLVMNPKILPVSSLAIGCWHFSFPVIISLGQGMSVSQMQDYHEIWEQFNMNSMRTNKQLGINRKTRQIQAPGPKYCLLVITLHLLIWWN